MPWSGVAPGPLLRPHRLPGPQLRGRLVVRRNRFVAEVALDRGDTVVAHVADRGRLEAILFPGAEVFVVAAESPGRSTAFSLTLARCNALGAGEAPLTCLEPAGANRLVRALLEGRALPGLPAFDELRPEVRHGSSRFDFALTLRGGERLWLEVKSCACASGESGLFPDTPSERASRHCAELAALVRAGEQAAIVIVAQRPDVREIRPHPIDPAFAAALADARRAGVKLLGVAFDVRLDGFRFAGSRPVRVGSGVLAGGSGKAAAGQTRAAATQAVPASSLRTLSTRSTRS